MRSENCASCDIMGVFLLKMIEQNGDRNILLVAKKFFGRQKKIPAVLLLIHTMNISVLSYKTGM